MKNISDKNKYLIIELLVIFLLTLLYNLFFSLVNSDEIWNYGFSYNIATGLLPYKDFNMVITPFFPFLGSIFLTLFGKNLVVYHIFNAILCTILFYLIRKIVPRGYYIVYAFLLLFSLPNYSLFCVLLLYVLMLLENKKSNDYLIGIVLGLTFLTKQNIGIMLCIPTLFTKDINKIIKRIGGFLIPISIFLIYLLFTNTLYDFVNYAFLGISSFAKENLLISNWGNLTIIAILYLIYKYIKNRDINAIYLLCFQIMAYPLFDTYHVLLAFIPVLGYFLKDMKLVVKIVRIAFSIFVILLLINGSRNVNYPNGAKIYKYRNLDYNTVTGLNEIVNYIKGKDNIYIINSHAYFIKLEAGIPITKYDLLNDGNMGKDGHIKIINEIDTYCSENRCIFLMQKEEINNNMLSQTNQDIISYINDNYKEEGIISIFTIYGNGEEYE